MNVTPEQIFLINPSNVKTPLELQKHDPDEQVNLENVEDFSNVCRTCATITDLVIPIFDGEGRQNNLAEKITTHLPIQVSDSDTLPTVVCYQCYNTLLAWHELVQCCVQADKALRTRQAVLAARRLVEEPDPGPSHDAAVDSVSYVDTKERAAAAAAVGAGAAGCVYCGAGVSGAALDAHLLAAHSERVFHCAECGRVLARPDLIPHMTHHSRCYTRRDQRRAAAQPQPRPPPTNGRSKPVLTSIVLSAIWTPETDPAPVPPRTQPAPAPARPQPALARPHPAPTRLQPALARPQPAPARSQPAPAPAQPAPAATSAPPTIKIKETKFEPKKLKIEESKGVNEFSDHSDAEDGFGPLPESVFEAIEDSQDSSGQPATWLDADKQSAPPPADPASVPVPAPAPAPAEPPHKKKRTCPICSKTYTASSSYFYHMKHQHKGSKDHECSVCKRRFGTKVALSHHATLHTGELGYECEQCGKKFRTNASLYIHRQTHGSEKTWECDKCGRKFRWKQQLKKHMLRHWAARAHRCATCGRGFNVRSDLLRHDATHRPAPFPCARCGAAFAQRRYLAVHLARKHPATTAV